MAGSEIRPSVPFKESLLSRVREVYSPLEKVILPKGNIEARFISRYLAIKILEIASRHAKTLKLDSKWGYENNKAEKLLDIAAVQAEIGENPIPTIKIAIDLKIDTMDVLIRARASTIAAYVGDEKLAFELAEKATRNGNPWPFRYTANILTEKGKDLELFLDKEVELTDTYQRGRNEFAGLRAGNFADTARSMHRHNRDPKPWLEKAKKTLLEAGEEESWAYNSLANAYAAIGDYITAKSLIKKIVLDSPKRTRDQKQRTLIQIAYKQAENGDIDGAVKTAYESGFQNGIAIILMKKAYLMAKKRKDPVETLDQALAKAKQIKENWAEQNAAIAYSTAGRILAIAGKNPDSMLETAIRCTEQLRSPTDKSDAYKHIAMDKFASGKDSRQILETVLLEESKLENPSILDDILEAAIECGYYQYFRIVVERLNSYRDLSGEDGIDIESWKINFLTKIAKALGENSITRKEITKLSEKDIQEIQNSKFLIAKDALAYFGKI